MIEELAGAALVAVGGAVGCACVCEERHRRTVRGGGLNRMKWSDWSTVLWKVNCVFAV